MDTEKGPVNGDQKVVKDPAEDEKHCQNGVHNGVDLLEASKSPEVPEIPKIPEQSEASEAQELSDAQGVPDAQEAPDAQGLPDAQDHQDVPAASEADESDARSFNRPGFSPVPLESLTGDGLGDKDENGVDDELWRFTSITPEKATAYDLSPQAGIRLALVFNHRTYKSKDVPPRPGTDEDVRAIKEVFGKKLGFKITVHNDLTSDAINYKIRELQEYPKILSCLAIFILTHGEENANLHSYDKLYKLDKHVINELIPTNCENLAGKPKLLFIQGSEVDSGAVVRTRPDRSRHTSTDSSPTSGQYTIPNYSDFLIFQASYYGHYSFRSRSGSWFIQSLCAHIKEAKHADEIHTIMTRTKRFVAINKSSNAPRNPQLHHKKQVPLSTDTLIRDLYLIDDNNSNGRKEILVAKDTNVLKSTNHANPNGQSDRNSSDIPTELPRNKDKKKKIDACNLM